MRVGKERERERGVGSRQFPCKDKEVGCDEVRGMKDETSKK